MARAQRGENASAGRGFTLCRVEPVLILLVLQCGLCVITRVQCAWGGENTSAGRGNPHIRVTVRVNPMRDLSRALSLSSCARGGENVSGTALLVIVLVLVHLY